MFADFQYRHIPALFTAAAQLWGTILPFLADTRTVITHYGLPPRIADVPETWPVWHAGNARTACLGILMFHYYARRRYDVLDTFMMITSTYMGLADLVVLWREGLPGMAVWRCVASLGVAALGYAHFTQGPAAAGVDSK